MKKKIIKDINTLLHQYDTETLEAIFTAIQSLGVDEHRMVKVKICKRIGRENNTSKLNYIWELLIRI